MPLEQPPVLRLAEPDALTRASGDDIRHAQPPLVADAPFSEAVGLPQPRDEAATVLDRSLSVGDDKEVKRLSRRDGSLADDEVIGSPLDNLRALEEFAEGVERRIVEVSHQADYLEQKALPRIRCRVQQRVGREGRWLPRRLRCYDVPIGDVNDMGSSFDRLR